VKKLDEMIEKRNQQTASLETQGVQQMKYSDRKMHFDPKWYYMQIIIILSAKFVKIK